MNDKKHRRIVLVTQYSRENNMFIFLNQIRVFYSQTKYMYFEIILKKSIPIRIYVFTPEIKIRSVIYVFSSILFNYFYKILCL